MENVRGLGMNIESILAAYRSPFEDFLQSYLEERVDDLTASHRIGREVGDILKEFVGDYVTGGKRIRAALVAFGYGAAGGENDYRAFSLAASIELVHSFFLVHDDIIDKSGVRRNRPTVHEEYRRIYKENGLPGESSEADHFSYSMGIIAGDVCETFAYDAILYSELSPEKIVELLKVMHKIVIRLGSCRHDSSDPSNGLGQNRAGVSFAGSGGQWCCSGGHNCRGDILSPGSGLR